MQRYNIYRNTHYSDTDYDCLLRQSTLARNSPGVIPISLLNILQKDFADSKPTE